MQTLTEDGQKAVADIAARHGVSTDAATQLLSALAAGGGRQAQFNHPDLGGMGQWSQGGMIMIGDMFNPGLKARVAALCDDLANMLHAASPLTLAPHHQRWPAELGTPAASGSQNDMHYAVFPETHRLAIERDGKVTVYDTGDHRIGGVSQQQSGDQSLQFTSQSGRVRLSDLRLVPAGPDRAAPAPPATGDDAVFSRLERLADLHKSAVISAEEFATKKAELLARL